MQVELAPEPGDFDHAIGADRFKVVRGAFWWHVLIGDSPTEHGKFRSRASAEKMAADLLREFRNGAFVQYEAALAEPVLQTCNCRWDGEMQMQQCTLHEAHVDAIKEWAQRAKFAEKKLAALAESVQDGKCKHCVDGCPACDARKLPAREPVAYTTGHCKEKAKPKGCQLHNLQCGYPECDRKPAQDLAKPVQCPAEPVQEPVAWYCKEGLKRGVSLKQETPEWIPLYTKEKP